MGQAPVVREQVDGGERLIRELRARGFDLVAAAWAREPSYGRWYLYLVSPAVENADPRPSYSVVRTALRDLDPAWAHPLERIDPFSVMLLAPSEPLGRGMLALHHHALGRFPTILGDTALGDAVVEGAYVYPATLFRPAPQPAAG